MIIVLLQVTLQEPQINLPKTNSDAALIKQGDAQLNTSNYEIQWSFEVPASETKSVNLKYQIEYPVGTTVTGI